LKDAAIDDQGNGADQHQWHLGAPLRGEAGLRRMERATTALFLNGIFRAPARGGGRRRR